MDLLVDVAALSVPIPCLRFIERVSTGVIVDKDSPIELIWLILMNRVYLSLRQSGRVVARPVFFLELDDIFAENLVHEKPISRILNLRKVHVAAILAHGEEEGFIELVDCEVMQVGWTIVVALVHDSFADILPDLFLIFE